MDDNGVYHIRSDCWQQYVHYTTGYDSVFKSAIILISDKNQTIKMNSVKIQQGEKSEISNDNGATKGNRKSKERKQK